MDDTEPLRLIRQTEGLRRSDDPAQLRYTIRPYDPDEESGLGPVNLDVSASLVMRCSVALVLLLCLVVLEVAVILLRFLIEVWH